MHECVHELKECLQHIFEPLSITYTHGKAEELSLTKEEFSGSSTGVFVGVIKLHTFKDNNAYMNNSRYDGKHVNFSRICINNSREIYGGNR